MRNEGAALCTHKARGWEFFFEQASERASAKGASIGYAPLILSLISNVHLLHYLFFGVQACETISRLDD